MNDKGFDVVAYNRTTSKVDHFLANEAKGNPHPSPDPLS
jgi:6-phosphogluconate dehydrogenase